MTSLPPTLPSRVLERLLQLLDNGEVSICIVDQNLTGGQLIAMKDSDNTNAFTLTDGVESTTIILELSPLGNLLKIYGQTCNQEYFFKRRK